MPIQSEEEAIALLEATRARLAEDGYQVAVDIARDKGTVQAQDVLQEMAKRGLFQPGDEELDQRWVAVVFKGKTYKHTWEKVGIKKVGNQQRNVHAAERAVWKIRGVDSGPKKLTLSQQNRALREQIEELEEENAFLRAQIERLESER